MTKEELIHNLINNPVSFAHLLGFNKLTDLHNEWIRDMIIGEDDESLEAHRGSFKTTCVSIGIALIMILLPKLRIAFMRKTDNDVKEVVKQVAKILLDPHTVYIVHALYGVQLRLTVQSATELSTNLAVDVKGTSQLVGIGTGASLTGKHFDRIFTDDIINVQDRVSRAERERTKIIYQELQNIKNRGGRIFNTLTPWHKDDASSLMPKPKKYTCYDTGLLTKEEIEDVKSKMTSSLFAANYELKMIADDDVMFVNPQLGADIETLYNGVAHVDAAYYGEDYTAFTIIAVHDGKYYVFGKVWRKHIDECMDDIVRFCKQFLIVKIYTETNADKGYSAKELKKRGLKVVTYHEDMNKHLKISTYLKFDWENIIFCKGTDEEYIDMVCDYNENSDHDDAPDSLASLIRKTKKQFDKGNEPQYHSVLGLM